MTKPNGVEIRRGSRVRIRYAGGREESLLIRGCDHESWAVDSIDSETPLARALVGKRAGDEVEFQVHEAVPVRWLTVLSVDAPRRTAR